MLNLSGLGSSQLGFGRLGNRLKKAVKELAKKGEFIPDAYTGKLLVKETNVSAEHVLPRSKGGANTINNLLLTGSTPNTWRGNEDWDIWLKKDAKKHGIDNVVGNIQKHLNAWRKVKTEDVDGNEYVNSILPTLNREARGVAAFAGYKDKKLDTVV